MKKVLKVILPIAFMALLIGPTFAKADYNVNVGDTFNYTVNKSSWDIAIGTNSSTGTGFEFEDVNYAVGTGVEVEVTAASTSSVDFDTTVAATIDSSSATPLDLLGVAFLLIYPALLTVGTAGDWNQTEIDLGPGLMMLAFVDPQIASDFFFDITNESFVDSLSDPEFIFTNVGGTFDNSSSVAIFEWHFDATFTTTDVNIAGTYVWKYAFDKTTGSMKGYYMDMDYAGTVDGDTISYKLTQLIEENGYNLPGVGLFPGFEWFIAIPAIASLGMIAVIIRRRK